MRKISQKELTEDILDELVEPTLEETQKKYLDTRRKLKAVEIKRIKLKQEHWKARNKLLEIIGRHNLSKLNRERV